MVYVCRYIYIYIYIYARELDRNEACVRNKDRSREGTLETAAVTESEIGRVSECNRDGLGMVHACERERENAKNRNICKIARKRWAEGRKRERANDLVRRRREGEEWKTSVHSRWRAWKEDSGCTRVCVCVCVCVRVCAVNTDRMCAEERGGGR